MKAGRFTHYSKIQCGLNYKGFESDDISKVDCKRCVKNYDLSKFGKYVDAKLPEAKYFKVIHLEGEKCLGQKTYARICISKDIEKVNCPFCLKHDSTMKVRSQFIVGFNDKYIRKDYTYTKDLGDKNLLRFSTSKSANKHMDDHISECIRQDRPFIHYNFVKRAA